MLHKYPTVFLYFDIPGYLIDVNVHPAKREIRFIEGDSLKNYIVDIIKNALQQNELIPSVVNEHETKSIINRDDLIPEPFEVKKIASINDTSYVSEKTNKVADFSFQREKDNNTSNNSDNELSVTISDEINDAKNQKLSVKEEAPYYIKSEVAANEGMQLTLFDEKFISEEAIKKHKIIGQLFDTYWLIEYDNKLFIMDQHAAHEKVNYER